MLNTSSVLETQLEACRVIMQEKIALLTQAMAWDGKVHRKSQNSTWWNFDTLSTPLTNLYKGLRSINADDFNGIEWRKTIQTADQLWWEWFDKFPLAKELPLSAINYTPRLTEQLALREQLRMKYAAKVEAVG